MKTPMDGIADEFERELEERTARFREWAMALPADHCVDVMVALWRRKEVMEFECEIHAERVNDLLEKMRVYLDLESLARRDSGSKKAKNAAALLRPQIRDIYNDWQSRKVTFASNSAFAKEMVRREMEKANPVVTDERQYRRWLAEFRAEDTQHRQVRGLADKIIAGANEIADRNGGASREDIFEAARQICSEDEPGWMEEAHAEAEATFDERIEKWMATHLPWTQVPPPG
jgi:hypothetical protein